MVLQNLILFATNFARFYTNGCFSIGWTCRLRIEKGFQKIAFALRINRYSLLTIK